MSPIRNRGFSTLEIMIAMVIMMMTFTAVILTTFGNQSLILGGQTNSEAMNKAQELLENQQASARRDFNLVNATSSIKDDVYTKSVSVKLLPDFLTKEVSARIDWKDEHLTPKQLTLTTLIANFENVAGGSTCNSSPEGDWKNSSNAPYSVGALTGFAGSYPVRGLDAYHNKLYVVAGPTTGAADKNFFTFNLSAGGVPTFVAGSALDMSGNTSTKGPTAIQVSATSTTAKTYAYLGNGVTPNWSLPSCVVGPACSQLEVVDVTNPAAPNVVSYFRFATSSQSTPFNSQPYITGNISSTNQAVTNALFYKNGYLFVGLTKTASGPEFIIMDVHDPLNPLPLGYYPVGATVEAIYMRNNFVYLATDSSVNPLLILDVTNPLLPTPKWTDTVAAGINKGNSFAAVGDTLYFTRDSDGGAIAEWYILDNADVRVAKPTIVSSLNLNQSILKVFIRDYLAYLLVGNTVQLRSATSTLTWAPNISLVGNGTAIDCENNNVFVGTDSGGISVLTAP